MYRRQLFSILFNRPVLGELLGFRLGIRVGRFSRRWSRTWLSSDGMFTHRRWSTVSDL